MPQADVAAFRLTPDLRFLFLHDACETAFAALCEGIRRGDRLLLLTGPYGVGKTLLLRRIETQLAGEGVPALYAAYPKLDLDELLAWCRSGAPAAARSCLAMIDDADRCSTELLAALHARLDSAGGDLGVRLLLAGGPQLATRLANEFPRLHALAHVHAQLTPLDSAEAGAYIRHRLDVLGKPVALASGAASDVFHYSQGIPRLINHACARALLLAGPGPSVVSQEVTREAIEDYVANTSFGQTNVARFVPAQPPAAVVAAPSVPAPAATALTATPQESAPQADAANDESPSPQAAPEPTPEPNSLLETAPPASAEAALPTAVPDEPATPSHDAAQPHPQPAASPQPVKSPAPLQTAVAEAVPAIAPTDIEMAIPPPPVQPRRAKEAPVALRSRRPNQMLRTLVRNADAAAPADPSDVPTKFAGFRTRRVATPRADLPPPRLEVPPRDPFRLELWPLVAAAVVVAAVLAIPLVQSRLHWLEATSAAELRQAINAVIADAQDALRETANAVRRKMDELL